VAKVLALTTELNHLLPQISFTDKREEAELIILGLGTLKLGDFPRLRGVFRTGVGTDNIDIEALRARNIRLALPSVQTRTLIYDETAAYTSFLVLSAIFRQVGDVDTWTRVARTSTKERIVLLVGGGNIGSRVKNNLERIARVIVVDPLLEPTTALEDILPIADVVSLHIPGGLDNEKFVNSQFLELMKDGAALVNTSRGSILDEEALASELSRGRLYAYLDVFSSEPYSGYLLSFLGSHLFASPHVASTSAQFFESMAEDFKTLHSEYGE
jgi:phosphoglycerate dehydrogenase-like enzyme